jgi:hypothetical protein
MSRSLEYKRWLGMIRRVDTNPRYIRKGIKVCNRWRESFDNFYADMGQMPEGPRIGVERLDNDGHYEPGKCIWAGPAIQNNNKGDTVRLRSERFNTSKSMAEWLSILIAHKGDTSWNRRFLSSLLKRWNIDQILLTEGITNLSAYSADDPFADDFLVAA